MTFIRVTALLEYFKWTLNYAHVKGHGFSVSFLPMLPLPRGGDRLLLLSNFYDLIIEGYPSHSIIIGSNKEAWSS